MYHIEIFTRERIYEDPTGKRAIIPQIINPEYPSTRNCSVPAFKSCILDRSNNISTGTTKVNPLSEKQGASTGDKYEVGDYVSSDKFICKTTGRLPTGYDREYTYR